MAKDDYEIGYKKPPKQAQFQPGQSGNPKGRPKGSKNLATDLQEELGQKVVITEANKKQTVTKQRAMLKTMFAKALKGDARSATVLINLILGLHQVNDDQANDTALSADDAAILAAYEDKLKEQSSDG